MISVSLEVAVQPCMEWISIKNKVKKKNEYFLKPKSLGANVKVELDLSNYKTK